MQPFRFADQQLNEEIAEKTIPKTLSTGTVLMNPGDVIQQVPLLTSGTIRVLLQNEDGDEQFLYHIFPGETCALSLTCCQAHRKSEIKAVVEENAEILFLPVRYVDEWMKFPEWKKFVSDLQAQRFTELLETIELMAFSRLDERLWNYLVKRAQATGSKTLKITHLEIAQELNSPREVITRLLHQLQKQHKITLSRNTISLF